MVKKRRIIDYRMQLAITQNPHLKEPEHLWKILEYADKDPVDEELDKAGMERLKQAMSSGKAFLVK